MTRAWVFLAHGRLGEAVSANPFALVTAPAAVVLVLGVAFALVRRQRLPDITSRAWQPATQILVLSWIAFGLVRAVAVATGHASI